MAESYVQLPDDSGNLGKKIRTQEETVGANIVHTHAFVPTTDSGSGQMPVDATNPLPVYTTSTALPTNAATASGVATRLADTTFTGRIGEVQASPTANTVLDRLKQLLTGIILAAGSNIIGRVGIDQTTDGTTNKVAATQATASNLNAQAVGNIAHDGVDSGNPVKVGARAIAHGTNPTAVAAADRTDLLANRAGVLFTLGGHPNVITTEFDLGTGAGTDTALVTVGSGVKIVVTRITFHVSAACTVNVAARAGFGASTLPATSSGGAAGMLASAAAIPPGGALVEGNGSGILGIGGDNEDLRITHGATTGGKLRVTVSYFTIES